MGRDEYVRRTIGAPRRRLPKAVYLLAVGAGLLLLLWMADRRIRPIMEAYGTRQAQTMATAAVNNAVTRVLADGSYTYEGLIHIQRGSDGDIQSAEADMAGINRLKAAATAAVLEELEKQDYQECRIPLGDLIGGDYFTGRGPRIPMRVSMNGTALSHMDSSFTAAGINQTRHEILLKITLDISLVLSNRVTSLSVETEFLVADTLLKGEVPDAFVQAGSWLGAGTAAAG